MTARQECLLEITCAAGGSRRSGPLTVAWLDRQGCLFMSRGIERRAHSARPISANRKELLEWYQRAREAQDAGLTFVSCRCPARGHWLDRGKVGEVGEVLIRLRDQPSPKARRVDVAHVETYPGKV